MEKITQFLGKNKKALLLLAAGLVLILAAVIAVILLWPYSKIQAYSIESAGVFDMDSELELYFSGLGKVTFEFVGNANVTAICQMISSYVLR